MKQVAIGTVPLSAPIVAAHGGAGSPASKAVHDVWAKRLDTIAQLIAEAYRLIDAHPRGLREAVLVVVDRLELDERFNAGCGSKLQRDGQIRVSAAIMDGARMRLSGIYNAPNLLHAGRLADAILDHADRNLDGLGARALMERLGISPENLATPARIEEWRKRLAGKTGTIGAVGLGKPDPARPGPLELWACTSTGGRGFETPGRISDTPQPCANYACEAIAISATGIGENIIDLNLAGRLATRVIDGMPLKAALEKCHREAVAIGGEVGLIAVTATGEFGWLRTTEAMPAAALDAKGELVRIM